MKTIRIYVTNYTTLTGIHDGTRAIIPTNDGVGSSTDIIRRRASSPTQDKSPQFEHRVEGGDELSRELSLAGCKIRLGDIVGIVRLYC
jgi:hypothetical protein